MALPVMSFTVSEESFVNGIDKGKKTNWPVSAKLPKRYDVRYN